VVVVVIFLLTGYVSLHKLHGSLKLCFTLPDAMHKHDPLLFLHCFQALPELLQILRPYLLADPKPHPELLRQRRQRRLHFLLHPGLVLRNALLPYKGIPTCIGFYLRTINKYILAGNLSAFPQQVYQLLEQILNHASYPLAPKPGYRTVVGGRLTPEKVHEVHIAMARALNLSAGIYAVHA
jgi:hypothetical protein